MSAAQRLVDAITACAARTTGPYGACYCREPSPNAQWGHAPRCKTLAQAIRAVEAAMEAPAP